MDGEGVNMPKIDRDIKKQWILFALVNMVLLIIVFGAFIAGYVVFGTQSAEKELKNGLEEYANTLKKYDLQVLMDACSGESGILDADNPSYSFGVYVVRGDGSYGFYSNDAFLVKNSPEIGGKADVVQTMTFASHEFLTYTTAVNDNAGAYIKVFACSDHISAANEKVKLYSIPFSIAFIALCVIIAIALGQIEIKPITDNYFKQKAFINDMSHEIRTPLAIIKGNLENVLATPEAKVHEVADEINSSLDEVDYMTTMSTGLLNIVRGENKSIKKEGIMSEAVSEVVDMFSDVAMLDGKALIACVDYCDIQVDKEKIKQLLTVLLDNSVKYTKEGDRINVKLKNTKEGCILTVSDTGIGVDKSELDLIFDRFYRAQNAKEINGTGLGLAVAKSIVESMNGTIKAMPNVPQGLEIDVAIKRN